MTAATPPAGLPARPETIEADVLVAGAGLPGLALAAALGGSGLSVVVADRNAVEVVDEPAWDTRIYAISPGNAEFLGALGAWQALPAGRIAPVETMRVEGDRGAVLGFDAYDLGEPALAWIVEERALKNALVPRVEAAGVRIVAPAVFATLVWTAEAGTLELADGRAVRARLVVGADGVRSWVRRAAGLVAEPRPYGQTAVVANFECERPHGGCARQWFLPDGGILAWLPMPGDAISIVWSAPEALATTLMGLSPEALAGRVAAQGGHALGALRCLTPGAAFPLAFLRLPAACAHRLALVGDAAHGVHPLAGQGVNLGFGDARELAGVLAGRGPIADPGAPLLLERYGRRRAEPVLAMQAATDGLAKLFGSRVPGAARLRNLGLAAVSKLAPIKLALARPALH